jgi:hypothetical protein
MFSRALAEQTARYRASLPAWRCCLDGLVRLRPRAVLTNILIGPSAVGLHKVLRERGLPLAVFQHGVTMEIGESSMNLHLVHENVAADLAIVFNKEARRVSQANPFRSCEALSVGLPRDYRRARISRSHPSSPPVWYISTALYLGHRGQLFQGITDGDKADHEIALIERVLDRLPHRVLYKPYPAFRYLDPDPVIEAARAAPNISVYEERADLRYLIQRARLLICSRSYSTPSWCLMSGRPVVHIDIPDQLTSEARSAFEAGLFLFDAGSADFHDRLRVFLSQPIELIERLYAAKQAARTRLIERFFATGGIGTGAGWRAAAAIRPLMAARP